VSAFSRTPSKLDITHPALTKIAGDFLVHATVRGAVAGHDAVILTAFGCGDSESAAGWFFKAVFINRFLKGFYLDHAVQERLTRESGLEFVIARPTRLTNGIAKGKYVRNAELIGVPSSISRADLADFLVEACESATWLGKAVQLGG
jgi:hypothetical protein